MSKKPLLKMCVFGNFRVGKTTIIKTLLKGKQHEIDFSVEDKQMTIGVDFYKVENFKVDGRVVDLQIWDMVGNERFRFLFKDYLRGAKAGIFVYDITDKDSLSSIDFFIEKLRKTRKNQQVPILVVGNKADLEEKREIKNEYVNELTSSKSLIGPIEISALNIKDVEQLFSNLIKTILKVDDKKKLIDVFRDDIDLRILMLLKIYKELSLTEITYHLGMSKATFSRRTKTLIRLGLLESFSKEGEPQKGTIKRKYYRLSSNFINIIQKKDLDLKSDNNWELLLEKLPKYSFEYKKIKIISDHLNQFIETTENLLLTSMAMDQSPLIETINLLTQELEDNLINYHYLTENQNKEVLALNQEFHSKLNKIIQKADSSEKRFLYLDLMLPIVSIVKV
ncbi:MAG: GTP-binding protein [Promethearchaeota archaeon]